MVRHRLLACESALVQIREGRPAPLPGGADPVEPEPAAEIGGAVRFGRPGVDDPAAWRALQAGLAERDALVEELRGEIRELKEQVRRLTQERDAALGVRESPVHVPAALRAEARRHLESGGVSNAVALLEETCRLRPDDEAAAHLLAAAYCRIGDYEAALRLAQPLARRLGRRSPDIWMTIGVAQLGLGNLGRSRVAFETALERDPGLAEAHFNLVQILIRLDPPDAEGAAARYEAARMAGAARDPDLESIIRQLLLARQVRQLK